MDPHWEAVNNRPNLGDGREIAQDFGFSNSAHIGGPPGEIGGYITPSAEAAYYAHPRRDEFPHQPREFVADVQTRLMREA